MEAVEVCRAELGVGKRVFNVNRSRISHLNFSGSLYLLNCQTFKE